MDCKLYQTDVKTSCPNTCHFDLHDKSCSLSYLAGKLSHKHVEVKQGNKHLRISYLAKANENTWTHVFLVNLEFDNFVTSVAQNLLHSQFWVKYSRSCLISKLDNSKTELLPPKNDLIFEVSVEVFHSVITLVDKSNRLFLFRKNQKI